MSYEAGNNGIMLRVPVPGPGFGYINALNVASIEATGQATCRVWLTSGNDVVVGMDAGDLSDLVAAAVHTMKR